MTDSISSLISSDHGHKPSSQATARLSTNEGAPLRLFWGDLHNHNAVGYAKGSLQRSIDLAREHLDFFAFTGHAAWHDMPLMPGDRHLHWVRGFAAHEKHWPKTKQMIHQANSNDFVALLGYEWHSSQFGDYCMIFADDHSELFLPEHAETLLDYAEANNCFAIPHHVGYKQGWRGANWRHFRQSTSPVVEIFSEHGCTESVRSPFPMLRHSNGGRSSANTINRQLDSGARFGFIASSDDHRGYPGAYGEGVVGVWARDLSPESIFAALRSRQTIAATGDRIMLEVSLNGKPMGADLAYESDRQIDVLVESQDSVQMIELVKNGRVIQRHFPEDDFDTSVTLPGRTKCRIQYGWGPWSDLDLGRVCDWEMSIHIANGRFLKAAPCFQAAPFDEDRRDRLLVVSETELRLNSPTTRVAAYGEDPTKSIVLELEGDTTSELSIQLHQPSQETIVCPLKELASDNVVHFTGVFTSESLVIGPLISPHEYTFQLRWNDHSKDESQTDWYYVRVTQHNGHMAWSSPIWIG